MESLLTISIGQYQAVELTLKLALALLGMLAFLMVASASCVLPSYRFPLLLGAAALLGALWFQAGVLDAWKEAFELAGTSFCVTGHLLDTGDRVMAWAVGVPLILFSFCSLGLSTSRKDPKTAFALVSAFMLLAVAIGAIFYTPVAGGILIGWIFILWHRGYPKPVLLRESRIAISSVLLGMILTWLGSRGFLPLGKTADAVLVHGEIIRGIADILSFVIPGTLLLMGVLCRSRDEEVSALR